MGWRRNDHAALAENVDGNIGFGSDGSPFLVVPVPDVMFAAGRFNNDGRIAMALERVLQRLIVGLVDVEYGNTAAWASHKADGRCISKAAGNLRAGEEANTAVMPDERSFLI
jgi:hypothetical protein